MLEQCCRVCKSTRGIVTSAEEAVIRRNIVYHIYIYIYIYIYIGQLRTYKRDNSDKHVDLFIVRPIMCSICYRNDNGHNDNGHSVSDQL